MLSFLVTGVAGFIGSNTAEKLLTEGYHVIGLDDLSTGKQSNLDYLNSLNGKFDFVKGSILDNELLDKLVPRCDYVIHLAAFVSSPKSIDHPLLTHKTNTTGTLNLFQAVSRYKKVKRIVYASTSAIYGDTQEMPIVEESPSRLLTPYAASKKSCEIYADAFSASYDFDAIGLRYFNVYGPRQDSTSEYSGVVSLFMEWIKEEKPVKVYGDGKQTRDFIYVKDVADINIKLCFYGKKTQHTLLNVGTGRAISINKLAETIALKMNKPFDIKYRQPRKGDIIHSCSNIDKLKRYIKNPINYHLEVGIEEYINRLNL